MRGESTDSLHDDEGTVRSEDICRYTVELQIDAMMTVNRKELVKSQSCFAA